MRTPADGPAAVHRPPGHRVEPKGPSWLLQLACLAAIDVRLNGCSTRHTRRSGTSPHRHGPSPACANWSLGELPHEWTDNPLVRRMSAGYEMIERAHLTHERPPFGIDQVTVAGEVTPVREKAVMSTPFSSLLHFVKDDVD